MNKKRLLFGIYIIAIGTCVLFTGQSLWAIRGVAEMALGGYLVWTS